MTPPDDELGKLWRSRSMPPMEISLDEIKAKSRKLARQIAFRNAREYVAGTAGLVFLVVHERLHPHGRVYQLGIGLLALGVAYLLWRLHRFGHAPKAAAADVTAREHIAHYRSEIARQRDLIADAARWYVAPIIPGVCLMFVGAGPARSPTLWLFAVLLNGAILAGVVLLNRLAARKLTNEIAALDATLDEGE
jgi:hypothetical protein